MRLDTESLRALKTTVELGSLTSAAARLNMTASAVSWKLKRLEQRLGRKLIHRNGHQIDVTADAKRLLEYSEIILGAHDRAVQEFRLSDEQGKVILGITDDLAATQIPSFVQDFHRRYPRVQLEIRVEQQLTLLEWFDQRSIDIAVLPLDDRHLLDTDIELWQDELIWVKSKQTDYPLSAPVPVVTFSKNCTYRETALQFLEQNKIDHYVSMESPSLAGVRGIVSSGMGVTLINRGLMTEDQCEWPEANRLEKTDISHRQTVKFVIRATHLLPENLSSLIISELSSKLHG